MKNNGPQLFKPINKAVAENVNRRIVNIPSKQMIKENRIAKKINNKYVVVNEPNIQPNNKDKVSDEKIMFITSNHNRIDIRNHFSDQSIFIICNGPSLVNNGYDLSLLKQPGVMTFGMNNGPKTIRSDLWTCVDDPQRFIKSIWLDPKIMKFVPFTFMNTMLFDSDKWEVTNIRVKKCPNVLFYTRNEKFDKKTFMFEPGFNWGNSKQNGGCRSVMLPALKICYILGFKKIYLMGVDFDMSSEYKYHFPEQRANGAIKNNLNTYDRLKNEYLPFINDEFGKCGIKIFNCNKSSKLDIFPYCDYNDAINECTGKLGDIANERTWGMYINQKEKQKFKAITEKI